MKFSLYLNKQYFENILWYLILLNCADNESVYFTLKRRRWSPWCSRGFWGSCPCAGWTRRPGSWWPSPPKRLPWTRPPILPKMTKLKKFKIKQEHFISSVSIYSKEPLRFETYSWRIMLVHGLNEQSLNMNSRSLKLKTLTLLLMRKCFICYTYENSCNKTENFFFK